MSEAKVRAIAFYLPQFHPIPENDAWWGKGFTEWTNVAKAKPLFKGHYQPHLPADLGFYDLRIPEVREAQAQMAAEHGIEGFCYWHYWFGKGRKILERPVMEVLKSGKPNFPFCLAWANETWSGIWHGNPKKILIQQTYPGKQDYIDYFEYLLPFFRDERYIKVDGKPLFYINAPTQIPDIIAFTELFRELASKNGLDGLYIVANSALEDWNPLQHGCDAVNLVLLGNLYRGLPPVKNAIYRRLKNQFIKRPRLAKAYKQIFNKPVQVYDYSDVTPFLLSEKSFGYDCYPCVVPNWDNSPRSGINSLILKNSTPESFEKHLQKAVKLVEHNPQDKNIVFIKSWNEWAEGNYLEPDSVFGTRYLEVLKKNLIVKA